MREVLPDRVLVERWVLDTAYGAQLDLVLPRAELVVGLDYPRWLSLARPIRRTVSRVITREPICASHTAGRARSRSGSPGSASRSPRSCGRSTRLEVAHPGHPWVTHLS